MKLQKSNYRPGPPCKNADVSISAPREKLFCRIGWKQRGSNHSAREKGWSPPDGTADFAAFLLSEQPAFVTGSTLLMDGGAAAGFCCGPIRPGLPKGRETAAGRAVRRTESVGCPFFLRRVRSSLQISSRCGGMCQRLITHTAGCGRHNTASHPVPDVVR